MRVVDREARARSWSAIAARWPDRVALCLSFIGFGVWSGITTVTAPGFTGLHVLFLLFDVELLAVGMLGLVGMSPRFGKLNTTTQILVAAAMLMLGLVLLIVEQSPFALLSFAFGLQAAVFARFLLAQERAVERVAAVVEADSGYNEAPPLREETGPRHYDNTRWLPESGGHQPGQVTPGV
jgi:hypothetical protein